MPTKGARTRRALVEAARQRFARDGFARTSLADIAGDAGVTPTAVYRYFPDKQAVFLAAVDADAEGLVQLTRAALLADDVPASVATFLGRLTDGLGRAVADHPLVARVLAGEDVLEPERILELPVLAAFRADLAELLAAGQELGVVRADLDPAQAALGLETVVLYHLGDLVKAPAAGAADGKDERWGAVAALLEAALVAPS